MKRQQKPWSCGAAVVRNVFRVYGLRVSEHEIRRAAKTTKGQGTNEKGIQIALKEWGFKPKPFSFNDKKMAVEWLHETLVSGTPVILAVENWEHWVVALGSLGPTGVAVFDSSNFKNNMYENSTYVWSTEKLLIKWRNDRKSFEDDEDRIYAIRVGK